VAGPADAPSQRAREDAELLALIDEIRGAHKFAATYGSPRVWLELRRRGVKVGGKRVERIMRVNGRRGASLTPGLEGRVDQAEPAAHRGIGAARPRLHRDGAEPHVGRAYFTALSDEWGEGVRQVFRHLPELRW
jgi:hypothetical protein